MRPLPDAAPTLAARWAESRRTLVERLRDEIRDGGPITFARFMDAALYDPVDGYYRRRDDRGARSGDFLTAPELDPIFGAALARQLEECWERLERPSRFTMREDGAGSGALALAVLDELRRRAAPLLEALDYLPVEVDPEREGRVRDRLGAAGFDDFLAPPTVRDGPITGVVIANELLDALPVHRVELHDGRLEELYVAWLDGWFAEERGDPSTAHLAASLEAATVELREGQRAEIGLAAQAWTRALGTKLGRGYALVIDYGAPATELYGAGHPEGLLRTYREGHAGADPFRAVGEQDLTAHVDLTSLERAAREAGLDLIGSTTQAEFLAGLRAGDLLLDLGARPDTTAGRYRTARASLVRLLDPAAMGRFVVIVLGRGVPREPPLSGLSYRLPAGR